MSSTTIHITNSATMGIYEPPKAMSMWRDTSKAMIASGAGADASSSTQEDCRHENKFEYEHASPEIMMEPTFRGEDAARLSEKVQRRLAQNQEAARKNRLRKKVCNYAYVQQLESSRLKLAQLEQQIQQTKQQTSSAGASMHSNIGFSGHMNTGLAAFEMEYGNWVEEQNRQNSELRSALQANVSNFELQILVEGGLNHYYNLFRIKAEAAKTDVFYLMSGMWRSSVERFFLWIGGFRPSELLNVFVARRNAYNVNEMNEVREQWAKFFRTEYLVS